MNATEKIRHLLDRYYDGSATPEEIRLIKSYFAGEDNIPHDLDESRRIFVALAGVDEIEVPPSLEKNIRAAIADRGNRKQPVVSFWKIVAGVAAALVLITVMYVRFVMQPVEQKTLLLAQVVETDDTSIAQNVKLPRSLQLRQPVQTGTPGKENTLDEAQAAAALLEGEASIQLLIDKINEASLKTQQISEQFKAIDKSLNKALK